MAATDKTYRPQKTLDIVFAVSCVLMLISIVWMFVQDYNREFKGVQRQFRDVDEALTERGMLDKLPDVAQVQESSDAVSQLRAKVEQTKESNQGAAKTLLAKKARQEADYQDIKAQYDSQMSLLIIDIDNRDESSDAARRPALEAAVSQRQQVVDQLAKKLDLAQRDLDSTNKQIKDLQKAEKDAEAELSAAEDKLKKITREFDVFAKATAEKRWKIGDSIRKLPVIDGFASPVKIQQYTLNDYPIDYSFKYVTRYDRCTTCHLGIDRPTFEKDTLRKLTPEHVPEGLQDKLTQAIDLLKKRESNGDNLGFSVSDLPRKVRTMELTDSQINEYCAHPRLDLFVGDNSAHPAEKFGCTSCHAGQGSATDFVYASHAPNSAEQRKHWIDKHEWRSIHDWDYPMLSKRFIESSCLKCHHQVTDLIRNGNNQEAPKLIRGYNLIKEIGCFGCHEIAGIKSGKEIGPDLRLEPSPPLDAYTPAERVEMLADPLNPPGNLRKVGPSLYRLSEKTNPNWTRRWIQSPRTFRPTTKMPHFYGLSNNRPDVLPPEQKDFPDAEVYSITAYLFRESNAYLQGSDRYRATLLAQQKELQDKKANNQASEKELRLLEQVSRRLELDRVPTPIAKEIRDVDGKIVTLPPAPKDQKEQEAQVQRGRLVFSERGCLACHSHEGTTKATSDIPAVAGDANFGPDLSRIAAKIAPEKGDADAKRRWLVQWVLNPNVHHPRTRMPVTHLTPEQAADVAAWLLAQPVEGWDVAAEGVPAPSSQALTELARVYLVKAPGMTRHDVDEILSGEPSNRKGIPDVSGLPLDADERELAAPLTDEKLQWYIGRKAITRLGCYGCHDIPGFATAKPIGTPLNDWGKKDAERLAFEDIVAFVKEHYHPVESLIDEKGHGPQAENGKPAYEEFFLEALEHHTREGFLNQKLTEPRSYDFHRPRAWDDRLRMPQFKFARSQVKPKEGETPEQAEARDEAEAREAVMTFILGLVAEQVPAKYLNQPSGDRLAEVKGRQVIDKFNCAGCHEIRPGYYEFKNSESVRSQLEGFYDTAKGSFAADHRFENHNAWVGVASPRSDRLVARGVAAPDNDDPKLAVLRLTEALRFTDTHQETKDIPAGSSIGLPTEDLITSTETWGGTLGQLLVPYLAKRDSSLFKEYKNARAALPPPLEREGEKVQPSWLFQFLRNPQLIRPATVLRMPRFNLSEDDAQAIVNYFAAVDRLNNPAEGLTYPYLAIPQRDEGFWHAKTQGYVARLDKADIDSRLKALQPIWEMLGQQQVADAERNLQNAEAAVKAAKPDTLKDAEKSRDFYKQELARLKAVVAKKDFSRLDQGWRTSDAYAADAYRLLANYNTPCLSCHQVGKFPPKQAQGPALDLTWERLRPEWTLHWIANPDRMLSYPTPMPQNFPRDKVDAKGNSSLYSELVGNPRQQLEAVRDLLMILPRAADLPVNQHWQPPAEGSGGSK